MTREPTLNGALGDVAGFALGASDAIDRDYAVDDGHGLALRRGDAPFFVEGERDERRLRCVYELDLAAQYEAVLEHDEALFEEQRTAYDLEATDDPEARASQRAAIAEGELRDLGEEAVDAAVRRLTEVFVDTTCRWEPIVLGEEHEAWNGFRAVAHLYPADDDWGERVYDETVQALLNCGAMAVEDVLDEVGLFDERPTADWDERGIR
jgi:hypothetical protein